MHEQTLTFNNSKQNILLLYVRDLFYHILNVYILYLNLNTVQLEIRVINQILNRNTLDDGTYFLYTINCFTY